MKPWLTSALVLCLLTQGQSLSAQYIYLDTNGNGVPDGDDGFLNYPAATNVVVWLKTNTGRDGFPDSCSNPAGQALTVNSYEFALRVVNGYATWGTLTNHVGAFTTSLGIHTTDKDYHSGYAGGSYQPAATYMLATLSVQSTSGLVPGKVALQTGFELNGTHYGTRFGSECLGRDSDGILKLGSDWVDADPLYTPSEWIPDGVNLSNFSEDEGRVSIASDGAGGAFIAFESVFGPSGSDIYVQRVDSRGNTLWSEGGHPACLQTDIQAFPRIIADGSGGCIVTWQDDRGAMPPDIFAQRLLPDGSIAPGWAQNGNPICRAASTQLLPKIASDGAGGAFITWKDARSGGWDTYVQRVSGAGVQPSGWPADSGIAVTTAPFDQVDGEIVADGLGGAIVAWHDARAGSRDIYAQRINSNGTFPLGWTNDGVALCTATGFQQFPNLAPDGGGGAVVAWHDDRSGGNDIYAQRVQASGAPAWMTDGVPLCTAAGNQSNVTVAASSFGTIVAWEDQRGADLDIYAQMISPTGALDPRWAANGDTVCIAFGDQQEPRIVSDGAGGALISWEDTTGPDDFDIFVQRVTPEGKALYGQGGQFVCGAQLNQRHPRLAPDGTGGAIIAWEDFRSGTDFDPYVMRIAPQGGGYATAVDQSPPGAAGPLLYPNVPNPFNPSTHIRFTLAAAIETKLLIVDIRGGVVDVLIDGLVPAGSHEVTWDGKTRAGNRVASGVYYCVLRAGSEQRSQTMVLMR